MNQGRESKFFVSKNATEKCEPYYREDNAIYEEDSCSQSESWDGSHSSCSSCTDSNSDDGSIEWEAEVQENGSLFFIESNVLVEAYDSSNPQSWSGEGPTPEQNSAINTEPNDRKPPSSTRGKLIRLIRRRGSKRHRNASNGSKHDPSDVQSNAAARSEQIPTLQPIKEWPLREIDLHVDPWVKPNLGRRATLSETLLGLVTVPADDDVHVLVSDYVPDGLAAKQRSIKIGDWVSTLNGKDVNVNNFNSFLATVNTPTTLRLGIQSPIKTFKNNTPWPQDIPKQNKVVHQSVLAEQLSGHSSVREQLQDVLSQVPVALLYLQLDGLMEGGPEDQGVQYCYPGPLQSNVVGAVKGAFLTLHHLLPDVTHSAPVSSTILIKGHLTHVVYTQEGRELLLLAVPHNRCSLLEAVQLCAELVRVLQFTYQSLRRCFSEATNRSSLDHFISIFFARLLTCGLWPDAQQSINLKDIVTLLETPSPPRLETILPAAHWVPLPREAQMQIDDALSELESNDLGDLCDDHDCQRLYTILGSCLYHKGHLLASHLARGDLVDINAYCRQQGLLHLSRSESVRSLVVWHEVFPSSVHRGETVQMKTDAAPYCMPEGHWFIMIVGQKHDMLVLLLEAGGCSSSVDSNPGPDVFYVEAAQDTLRHIQMTGVTSVASKWLKSNLRPQTVTPEAVALSRISPRRVNNLLGLRLPQDASTVTLGRQSGGSVNLSSPSLKKTSDGTNIMKRRASPDQLTVHSGSGPLHGETSEDSASLVASLPSDDTGPMPVRGRRAERERGNTGTRSSHSDHDISEDSDSDWENFSGHSRGRRINSTMDLSDVRRSLLSEVEETVPSKLTMGLDNIVFHYVHIDVSEGVLLSPSVLQSAQHTPPIPEVLANFQRCALHIHTLLKNTVSFKKLKGVEASQSFINKSLVAIKEFGALFECPVPTRGGEKQQPPLTYWVVGRLFFMPTPREVYVCYHDTAPQNMVEIAFRLALTSFG